MRVAERMGQALAASFFSKGWAAALGLFAVPLYLRFLGLEAYGVIGIFASLSAAISLLDLGLGATLTREMSRLTGGGAKFGLARDTARTFEFIYLALALLAGFLGALLAYLVGMFWVTVEALTRHEVVNALMLASIALACQWPANLYSAGLTGLQRQMRLGGATIIFSSFRVVLTLLVIWWTPTVGAFFYAQIAAAVAQTWVLRFMFWASLETEASEAPKFQWKILHGSLGFAGGMAGIALTSLIQTQADKFVLSKALTLAEFGVYVLVGTLASGLYLAIGPFFSVMFPRFTTLIQRQDQSGLATQYHAASQLIAVLVVPAATVLALFGEEVLYVWTGDSLLGVNGKTILLFLILGNACNGLVNMPYAMQLALGRTQWMLWINVVSVVLLVPGVWWAATRYGAVGGAAVWALLNFGYLLVLPAITHRLILPSEKRAWYLNSVALPVAVGVGVAIGFRQIDLTNLIRLEMALVVILYWTILTIALVVAMPQIRGRAIRIIRKIDDEV